MDFDQFFVQKFGVGILKVKAFIASTFISVMRVGIFFKILQFASITKRQNSRVLKLKK
jgi:hypothetical protein